MDYVHFSGLHDACKSYSLAPDTDSLILAFPDIGNDAQKMAYGEILHRKTIQIKILFTLK